MSTESESKLAGGSPSPAGDPAEHGEMEQYAGGHIVGHHGTIPAWLLVVYAVLFVWALYYMVSYWGGLGPGLSY
jgi:hypothetical protein